MSHITLVRHGQANTEARDEDSYDNLSDLGRTQAAWLGEHLRETQSLHVRLYCGTLRRHIQTAQAMETGLDLIEDARLNEMPYFDLAAEMEARHGIAVPEEREEFAIHMPRVFAAWRAGDLPDAPESFANFESRVGWALADIARGDGPALVVTSGGLIAMAMRNALGLDTNSMARMALAIMNSSMHRLFPMAGQLSPVLFNAVPHLDRPDRQFALTHL